MSAVQDQYSVAASIQELLAESILMGPSKAFKFQVFISRFGDVDKVGQHQFENLNILMLTLHISLWLWM